ncbi:hypothetical protein CsSME_00053293 [Camellia sinensis var. sinensis]
MEVTLVNRGGENWPHVYELLTTRNGNFMNNSASSRISESCFAEIAKEGAMTLFGFPELAAKFKKLSPENF